MKKGEIHRKRQYAKKKSKRKQAAFVNTVVDLLLTGVVAIIPCIFLLLYGVGVPVPKLLMGIYMTVVPIVAGILYIVFALREKFGFGKEDYRRFYRWLTKKEAKEMDVFWGSVLIAVGILFAGLTAYYCT